MLGPDQVHVWRIDLTDSRWDTWQWVLDDAEHARASRFKTAALQARWRRCRSALRCILANYTEVAPAALQLLTNQFGKPALAGTPVHFNLSHISDWALVAISHQSIGVDIEPRVRPEIAVAEIAPLVCHPEEDAALQALAGKAANQALMRLWTQKEAYVKALGVGLQHPLTSVRVIPGQHPGCSVVLDHSRPATPQFFMYDVEAPPQCQASLCISTCEAVVRARDASVFLPLTPGFQKADTKGQHHSVNQVAGAQWLDQGGQ